MPFLVTKANFLLITKVGENKLTRVNNSRTRKQIKAWQPNARGSTLNPNRNSDVGSNQGQLQSQTYPIQGHKINDTYVYELIKKVITLKKPVNTNTA